MKFLRKLWEWWRGPQEESLPQAFNSVAYALVDLTTGERMEMGCVPDIAQLTPLEQTIYLQHPEKWTLGWNSKGDEVSTGGPHLPFPVLPTPL